MRTWMITALLPLFSAVALAGTPLPDAPHVVVQGEGLVSVAAAEDRLYRAGVGGV